MEDQLVMPYRLIKNIFSSFCRMGLSVPIQLIISTRRASCYVLFQAFSHFYKACTALETFFLSGK